MANKKPNYVKQKYIKQLIKDYDYLIVLGMRSNGKSYACKSLAVQEAIDSHGEKQFIYLRRYAADIKDTLSVNYFSDLDVYAMTKGQYDCIDVFRKGIYLANIDLETGKITNRFKIGHVHALSEAERYKSLSFPKVKYIIYEEFISKEGRYLYHEAESGLQHYVSTIYRNHRGKVFLIGNKISRICPYFRNWNLSGVMKQKDGTVETYKYTADDGTVTNIGVYMTDVLNVNSGMFFGSISKNINKGAYETDEQPHLAEPLAHYQILYTCVVQFEEFKFLCRFLKNRKDSQSFTWYVEPKTSEIKKGTRLISPVFSEDIWHTTGFDPLTKMEGWIFDFIYNDKICFSDNLTGTEFRNILKNHLS